MLVARAVLELRYADVGDWVVEALGSSLNTLDKLFLEQLYAACQGVDPLHLKSRSAQLAPFALSKIKIIYPTTQDVQPEQAKHVFHWGSPPFASMKPADLRGEVVYHCRSKSGRPLHAKLLLVAHSPSDPSAEHEAFLYFGSHNVTSAAWGMSKKEDFGCRQFELGALFRLAAPTLSALDLLIDQHVPYQRPLIKYAPGDIPYERPEDGKRRY